MAAGNAATAFFAGQGNGDLPGPRTIAFVLRTTTEDVSARLGMLAAAEKLRGAFDANWAPGEDESVERFVRGEIRGMILAAGVDPEAWEKARQHD